MRTLMRDLLLQQMKACFEGDAWYGPSLMLLLTELDVQRAGARPIASGHSAWEIVLHITTWKRVATERLRRKAATSVADDEDWPAVTDISESAWKQAITALRDAQQDLIKAVAEINDDSEMSRGIAGTSYNVGFLLMGIVEHDLYHTGQIALLAKHR